tara:strand:- start:123109 stop:123267 length:159 start_codon:yes stop_codon:yes gene_type:complete
LASSNGIHAIKKVNIVFVITDGLSATAVNKNAFIVLDGLPAGLNQSTLLALH